MNDLVEYIHPTVKIDNQEIINKLSENLKSWTNFNDKDFFKEDFRKEIINKLNLTGNPFWEKIRDEILNFLKTSGYVIVKNLPFDSKNLLFLGFSSFLGNPIVNYSHRTESMITDVFPLKGKVLDPTLMHTDSSFWPEPNDITILHCIRKDKNNKGKSRVITIDKLLDSLPDSTKIFSKFEKTQFPFALDPRFGDAGFQMQSILTKQNRSGNLVYHVRFNIPDTKWCLENFQITIPEEDIKDLIIFEKIASKLGKEKEFLLENGDLFLYDNKRVLHSRTPCLPDSDRLLQVMKINLT